MHRPCLQCSLSQADLSCQAVVHFCQVAEAAVSSGNGPLAKSWHAVAQVSCQQVRISSLLQVAKLQERLSDSNSLTARLKRELLLMKAKAEALEFAVSAKDAEIELLHARQDHQDSQVCLCFMMACSRLPKQNSAEL